MASDKATITELIAAIRTFAQDRDWEQFHAPKNLSMALAAEAGELMEHFLWCDVEKSQKFCDDPVKKTEISDELADILIYAFRFADVACIDPVVAINEKMQRNKDRYPVEKAKGRSDKYNEL
ncbi:MAG: nucleotide pyrophosphohydrolase [Opitutae bacterium]|jgi:dCTP diphosphatase|nr:nucleotide pyrophosphohydrolase [Opitutae bacterium]MBT6851825.1 nucleotide pyrophosphohydrolase [Opitutae bacterium]MBT7742836.1 nucleotide pyrophosphohydrolase [Opitutae bacterium]MBT7922828.1 nucleotide pyrophosphohydrolase [Opitutae bacterium]